MTRSLSLSPRVLSNFNFLKLWSAQFTSQIGLNALYFVLTIKIYLLTSSNAAVSVLIVTFTAPSIFLAYIAGVFVDQLSLKKVMLYSNLVRAAAVFLLIVFLNETYLLFVLVLLLAIATLFFIPAEGSSLPAIVDDDDLIAANSFFTFTLQVSLVLGFLVGGFSLRVFGEIPTMLGILATFIISSCLIAFLPKSIRSESQVRQESILKRILSGIIFVVTTKKVRDSLFFITLTTTTIFILATIGPGFVDKVLHLDVSLVTGMVIVPATIGMASGSLLLTEFGNRFAERALVNLGLFGMGVTFLLLTLLQKVEPSPLGLAVPLTLLFLIGFWLALITIPSITSFQKNTPETLRGRAYGLMGMFTSGVAVMPLLISGALADLYGVRIVLLGLAIVMFIFGAYRLRRGHGKV